MKKNYKDITIILTLYKTPTDKLDNLINYKNYKILIFDQEGDQNTKKFLKKKLKLKVDYFASKQNIGLTKSSNILLSKVKTKYCLFTQPDILIKESSIRILYEIILKNKNLIFVSPNHLKKKWDKFKENEYQLKNKIDFSCILCDVNKLKKIGFFDEDFFLYWEDIFLEKKINISNYKMAIALNAKVNHDSSTSSSRNYKIEYIRLLNFIYGEFVYDYKLNKLRFIKIFRKLIQNIFLFIFNILFFQLKKAFKNFALLSGILKFLKFYIKKKIL